MRVLGSALLMCAAALLTGCSATGVSSGTNAVPPFKSPGLIVVLPASDTSATMDAVVSGIAARKAAAAERARKVALALAAKAAAQERARLAARAATRRMSRTASAHAVPTKHVLTEAEKAAAMKAIAEEMISKNPQPPFIDPRRGW